MLKWKEYTAGESGGPGKDPQIADEEAPAGSLSWMKSATPHLGGPEAPSRSDLGDQYVKQKANLVICTGWILVTGMLENSVLGIFLSRRKNMGN